MKYPRGDLSAGEIPWGENLGVIFPKDELSQIQGAHVCSLSQPAYQSVAMTNDAARCYFTAYQYRRAA